MKTDLLFFLHGHVGICSDTPPELVMCSLCPRSFCATCLTRVLIPQEVLDLEKPQDWLCMCCTNHMDAVTPSLKNSDWKPVLPNTMNKTKSHSIIEKKTFADYFFEDVIEEIPACPRVHFLDDTMDDDDFLSDDDCEFPPQSVAIPREMGIDILCISPEEGDVTVYEVVDISEVIQCLHTAVSQEDGAEEAELHSKSPTDPVTESDSLAGAEQVQNASPKGLKCVNTEPGGTADCVISPMEDEICMLASSSSDVSTDSPPVRDEASSVTTLLVDAQLCDTAVCVLSPIFCPVSEDTHYFSQYLEVCSCYCVMLCAPLTFSIVTSHLNTIYLRTVLQSPT